MFANKNRRDEDPDFLQVKKTITAGETVKTKTLDACAVIARSGLFIQEEGTIQINGQCIDLASDVIALHGVIQEVGEVSPRFAIFGGPSSDGINTVQALKIPYAAEIVAFAAQYQHSSSTFSAGAGELLEISIGNIPAGSAHSAAVYAANLVSPANLIVFDENDDSTHPSKQATGLSLAVAAGDQLAVRAVETGSVGANSADIGVTIWLRGVYA